MENDTVFLKSILQAKNEDEFRLKNISIDKLGMTHKKFQQYYIVFVDFLHSSQSTTPKGTFEVLPASSE